MITKHQHRIDGNDRAAILVVAACGHVRDPARAVTELCWALSDTSDLTLAELLAERREAKEASDSWLYERDVVQRRRDDIDPLRNVARFSMLVNWLGSERACEVLRALIGTDPAEFLDSEPDLAGQVVDWFSRRRRINRFQARDLAQSLVAALEARHVAVWQEQARRLLAAEDDITDVHPRLCRLAATLAAGNLASAEKVTALNDPPAEPRALIQKAILGDYYARLAHAVLVEWSLLGWRDRRRITPKHLDASYDEQHLLICDTCALVYPVPPASELIDRCRHCNGALRDWPERATVFPPAQRLDTIQDRLRQRASRRDQRRPRTPVRSQLQAGAGGSSSTWPWKTRAPVEFVAGHE